MQPWSLSPIYPKDATPLPLTHLMLAALRNCNVIFDGDYEVWFAYFNSKGVVYIRTRSVQSQDFDDLIAITTTSIGDQFN